MAFEVNLFNHIVITLGIIGIVLLLLYWCIQDGLRT